MSGERVNDAIDRLRERVGKTEGTREGGRERES